MNRRETIKALGLLSSGIFMYQCAPSVGKAGSSHFTLAYRLHPNMFTTDKEFAATRAFFHKHQKAVNELALFDETLPSAPCAPLDFVREMTSVHQKRIVQFKQDGIPRVGINVLNNLGHGNRAGIWEMPYQPMIGHDGKESLCPCPNDPEFRKYLNQRYQLTAQAQPDFIWMDDDFRMISHGVQYPCFCPICLGKFDHETAREDLVNRLSQPKNKDLRLSWSEFCNQTLTSLARELTATVNSIDPQIEMGLMTIGYTHRTYAGNDVHGWSKAFQATMGRPGHGFYRDDNPRQITNKIFEVGRQVRDYAPGVKRIEYEQEEWPYITLNKSTATNLNESTLAFMAGCNGIAYNVFYERDNTNLQEYDPLLKQISQYRPFWEKLVQVSQNTRLYGFWPMDHPDLMARREVGPGGWFQNSDAYDIQKPNQLSEIGIPFTNSWKNSCGVLMSGRMAEAFTDEQLLEMLSGAVYMDAQALDVLWQRGLGELAGVKHVDESVISVEVFSSHPLNQELTGTMRRAEGWSRGSFLEKVDEQVEAVNDLYEMSSHDHRGISLSLYENELGGRIAVSSYHPWRNVGMLAKVTQLSRLFHFLSRSKMPVKIDKPCRIMPLFRKNSQGGFVLSLFNSSFDVYEDVPVVVKSYSDHLKLLTDEGEQNIIAKKQDDQLIFNVDRMAPWSVVILYSDDL
ncbi:MAG: hypothetical protein ACNS62_08850 [Candidatus Cyclobacteriaceae bacterium M3_2C_046]